MIWAKWWKYIQGQVLNHWCFKIEQKNNQCVVFFYVEICHFSENYRYLSSFFSYFPSISFNWFISCLLTFYFFFFNVKGLLFGWGGGIKWKHKFPFSRYKIVFCWKLLDRLRTLSKCKLLFRRMAKKFSPFSEKSLRWIFIFLCVARDCFCTEWIFRAERRKISYFYRISWILRNAAKAQQLSTVPTAVGCYSNNRKQDFPLVGGAGSLRIQLQGWPEKPDSFGVPEFVMENRVDKTKVRTWRFNFYVGTLKFGAVCVCVWDIFLKNNSDDLTIGAFWNKFGLGLQNSITSPNSVNLWVKNFRQTARTSKQKPPGRKRIVRTPANSECIR